MPSIINVSLPYALSTDADFLPSVLSIVKLLSIHTLLYRKYMINTPTAIYELIMLILHSPTMPATPDKLERSVNLIRVIALVISYRFQIII